MRWQGLATMAMWVAVATTSALAGDQPPTDPEARRTWVAERREEALRKREEFLKLSPEEQEKIRAERRAAREARRHERGETGRSRDVAIQGSIPLPLVQGGMPAGETCPAGESCTLRLTPPASQVLVVTAVWSATGIECDGVKAGPTPGTAVVSPWWRCGAGFSLTGPGAGYLGFLTAK